MNLVPWPRQVEPGSGSMQLTAASNIVADTEGLRPLAEVLAEEIYLASEEIVRG